MKETLEIQGIQLLMEKYRQQKDIFEEQEKEGNEIDVKQTMDSYEQAKKKLRRIRIPVRTVKVGSGRRFRFLRILSIHWM